MKKLKITSLILAVIMVVSMLPLGMVSAWAAEIASAPDYKIGTAAEFVTFINNWYNNADYYKDKTVALTADIDLSSTTLPDIRTDKNVFTGTFDGQGHKIIGYKGVVGTGNNNHGMFGHTLSGTATIKNVTIDMVMDTAGKVETHAGAGYGAWNVGGLYGNVAGGTLTVDNVKLTGTVHGRLVGGLVSSVSGASNVTVTNTDVALTVAHHWTGDGAGYFGQVQGTSVVTVENSKFSGEYKYLCTDTQTDEPPQAGGFIGQKETTGTVTFRNCELSGNVNSYLSVINYKKNTTTMNSQMHYIGGFVGRNNAAGTISFYDCTVSGTVKANVDMTVDTSAASKNPASPHVGGFVGHNSATNCVLYYENCTMSGDVSSTYTTGLTVSSSWNHVGGFTANCYGTSTYVGCTMSGSVDYALTTASGTGGHTAGFMGQVAGTSSFTNCAVTGTVQAAAMGTSSVAGGYVGNAQNANNLTFTDCVMDGSVATTGTSHIGGFIGKSGNPTTMTRCTMGGTVMSNATEATSSIQAVGGFVGCGAAAITLTDCAMGGQVASTEQFTNGTKVATFVGGILGWTNKDLTIKNTIVIGNVSINSEGIVGGFIGNIAAGGTLTMTDDMMLGSVHNGFKPADTTYCVRTIDRTAGIAGYVGCIFNMTNVMFYGKVSLAYGHSSSYSTGFISGCYPTSNNGVFTGCIYAGTITAPSFTNAEGKAGQGSTRPTFINGGAPKGGTYNVEIGGAHNGPAVYPNAQSAYKMVKSGSNVSSSYGYVNNKSTWSTTSLSKSNYATTINNMATSDTALTDTFAEEKVAYKKYLEDNFVLTTGLPIPKGCVATPVILGSGDALMNFATALSRNFDYIFYTNQDKNPIPP